MHIESLSEGFQALDRILEETGGEITPEVEEALALLITESKDALESAGFYRLALERRIQVCKDRRAALEATKGRLETVLERLNLCMAEVLKRTGKQKFPEFTLSTTTRQSVAFETAEGVDVIDLPPAFYRVKEPELNVSALKEAHRAGQLPAGVLAMTSETTTATLRRANAAKTEEPAA